MLVRSILLVALICAVTAAPAESDSSSKRPCEAMAKYLRQFAQARPITDTGWFEFLNAAAHLADEKSDPNAFVSAVPVRHFDTLQAAIDSIPGAQASDVWFDEGAPVVRDLRPYSNHVLLSEIEGTANCHYAAVLRVEKDRVTPIEVTQKGEICWTSALLVIRVGRQAFLATRTVDAGPSQLQYRISLHHPEGPIGDGAGFCRVIVDYRPQLIIKRWYTGSGSDPLVSDLRQALEPIFTQPTDVSRALATFKPAPNGTSPFDEFLRSDGNRRDEALERLDPDVALNDMPFAENVQAYSYARNMTHYALEIRHRRFILGFGQPELGWRKWSDNAFALWEWNGQKLVPFASGYVEKRAEKPTITVE